MRTLSSWLSEYGESHQHPMNVAIHKVAVPLIMLSVLGLGWSLSPLLAIAMAIAALIFYVALSVRIAVMMALFLALELGVVYGLSHLESVALWLLSLLIFVVAWIFQFIGHAIEGRRPSFLKDLAFLLIGPVWVLKKTAP